MSSEEESDNLLVFAERPKRPHTSKPTGRHNACSHFIKGLNCEVCEPTKTVRGPCTSRTEARGYCIHHPETFGDAITADRTVLNVENESRLQHRYTGVVQYLLHSYWIQSYPTKEYFARDNKKACKSSRQHIPGIIHTDSSLEFFSACEDLCCNHDMSIPYRSENIRICRNAVRR